MNRLLGILQKELDAPFDVAERVYPSDIPSCVVPRARFAEAARLLKRGHALLAAEWAADETVFGRGFGVYACYRFGGEYLLVKSELPADDPSFPTLAKRFVPAYRMERQMHSLMGVVPTGHPDLRPWIKFEDWPSDAWPLRKGFDPLRPLPRVAGEYAFGRAEGEGVYEIPVGPVHAGIIEPGHFRFQALGEDIINLEERLGYVHKGIEKRFESMGWLDAVRLAGRVSGDSTVAHSLAYCLALETMTGAEVPRRAMWLRALFLERERIANHLGDIGAICNDVAFAFMLYQTMRLKEQMLRLNHKLFGHRFMMDGIIPGGVASDIDTNGISAILAEMNAFEAEFEQLVTIYDENSSLDDRLRTTGELSSEEARDLGVCGFVARASGMNLDCRVQRPFPPYDLLAVRPSVLASGDVHARAWVRVEEVRESMRLVRQIISDIPAGDVRRPLQRTPVPDSTGFGAVEGWRGETIYWLQAGPSGEINRCMVRDPSSLSWIGLERCVQGNIVPDFPLCNKSFNQSYSGHDV
ncbi:MAG TPA: NADH-quinone oxidoreductase subunit C [Dissulfurispiraceae bacterium]|nr:NADH-quinone oxidoreductase subunit C [Dissulfurispiraceae bacterium]